MTTKLIENYKKIFGNSDEIRCYFSPGRVNLIGEHTDYNGGHVFPCAINLGTYFAAGRRDDSLICLYSDNFRERGIISTRMDRIKHTTDNCWADYPLGIIWAFNEKYGKIPEFGLNIYVYGDLPNGSGLSSSASIEVGIGTLFNDFYETGLSPLEIALLAQFSENNFNKVKCGIMDQFAVAMGKKNNAIFLDTSDLSYSYVPLLTDDFKIIIISSNKKRCLNQSEYNIRREQCESALSLLKLRLDIKSLGELSSDELESNRDLITDDTLYRRSKHAVNENMRTKKAVDVLKNNDIRAFGKLMKESHISLRDDYEVTGLELDTLYNSAIKQEGVIGARMSGAGFGGCTVNLVKNDYVNSFINNVDRDYFTTMNYSASFYIVETEDGSRRIK